MHTLELCPHISFTSLKFSNPKMLKNNTELETKILNILKVLAYEEVRSWKYLIVTVDEIKLQHLKYSSSHLSKG